MDHYTILYYTILYTTNTLLYYTILYTTILYTTIHTTLTQPQVVRGVGDVRVEAFDLRVAKIENTIQQLSACAGLEGGGAECTYGVSLRATYENLRLTMGKQLNKIEEKIAGRRVGG
jgi:hypothetical protein